MNFISLFPSLHCCSILALTLRILLNRLLLVSIKIPQCVESYPKRITCFTFLRQKQLILLNSKYSLQIYLPKSQIADALEQCLKYKLLVPAENEALFSTCIFKDDGTLLFATRSRSLNDATLLIDDLRSDKINWQEDDVFNFP